MTTIQSRPAGTQSWAQASRRQHPTPFTAQSYSGRPSPRSGRSAAAPSPAIWQPHGPSAAGGGAGCATQHGAVLVLPGFLNSSQHYSGLLDVLHSSGYAAGWTRCSSPSIVVGSPRRLRLAEPRRSPFTADVVPMSVWDWLPVISGGSFEWYLDAADTALAGLAKHGRVALVGHSAGGWLARLLMGSEPYQGVRYGRQSLVSSLTTLGTPHHSIENYPMGRTPESLTGVPEAVQTSTLQYTNFMYPSADCFPDVRITCLCGNAVRGRALFDNQAGSGSDAGGSEGQPSSSSGSSSDGVPSSGPSPVSRFDEFFAYESYKASAGLLHVRCGLRVQANTGSPRRGGGVGVLPQRPIRLPI